MPDQFSNTQQIRKPAVTSKGGIIAAQSRKAAEVGAAVLAAGGDCVDAVVATTFALGVVEPWMSGLGGGGAMVVGRARENRYEVIDYGMRAPNSLRVEDYPLTGTARPPTCSRGRGSRMTATFMVRARSPCPAWSPAWRKRIAATPNCPGRNCSAPASALAGEGLLVDWWTTLMIASAALDLRRYPASSCRLSAGRPAAERAMDHQIQRAPAAAPPEGDDGASRRGGDRAISTTGDLARSVSADVQAGGGALSVEDLASFRAYGREPLTIPYRGGNIYATPELTCGPTMAHTMRLLQQNLQPARSGPDAAAYTAYALALQSAYRRAPQRHGRRRRPPRPRRRGAGTGLHHAFLGGGPRRQHGGGDADPAVQLRLQIRHATERHHHEQRHHVVRSDTGPRRTRWRRENAA